MRWGAPAPQGGGTATAGVTAEAADMRAERVVYSSASRTSFLIARDAETKSRPVCGLRPRPQARPSACAVRFFVKRGRGHTATPYRYRYITARVCPLSCVSLRIAILLGFTDYGSRTGSKLVHVGVEMKTLPVEAFGLSSTLA